MSENTAATQSIGQTSSSANEDQSKVKRSRSRFQRLMGLFSLVIPSFIKSAFWKWDKKNNGAISFFFRHYGKTKFMVAMSKKIQYLGIERVWMMDRAQFCLFFFLYLVRDLVLYIAIPIYIARLFLS